MKEEGKSRHNNRLLGMDNNENLYRYQPEYYKQCRCKSFNNNQIQSGRLMGKPMHNLAGQYFENPLNCGQNHQYSSSQLILYFLLIETMKKFNQFDVGTISETIHYFKTHTYLFEQEENNKSHMERVMAVLNQDNMEHLEKQFQLYSRGLELPTFIYLMKNLYIPDNELSKYFFVSDLIKFFQAIDINGDGHLQWSQFTEYIIQNIRVVEKPKYKNVMFQENEIISSAYSRISNQYKIKKVWDLGNSNITKKIIYSQSSLSTNPSYSSTTVGFYYLLQNYSSCLKIYNVEFKQVDLIELEQSINKTYIQDFSLNKKNSIIGILFEDSLYFINLKVKAATKNINQYSYLTKVARNFNKIEYLEQLNLWFVSTKMGEIFLLAVDYQSRVVLNVQVITSLKYHVETITQVIELETPSRLMVTSSLDGTIKMYSIQTKQVLTFESIREQTTSAIDEKKKKGIQGIDGSCQFGNYAISYAFNNEIYIYSLDMSVTKGYVGKYIEHSSNIVSANFLKGYPYVISFDQKLNFRIWDFRKLNTIQLLNCQKIFINPSSLSITIIPEKSEILISEKKITQFKAPLLQQKSKEINEFHDIFDIKYCPYTNSIYIFSSIDVRIYSYYTGTLQKLFTKLYENNYETNITAAEFGYKNKRFFVGDAAGYVRQYCSETGDFLQKISPDESNDSDDDEDPTPKFENKQIIKIIFLKDHSLLICCSIDGRIMIYERNQQSEFQLVRDFRECHEEITCASACSRYCLLATGGDDGTVNLWNLSKYAIEGVCVMSNKIVGIAFSPIHPIMMIGTEDGYINFVYVRPCENWKLKNKCFTKIRLFPQQHLGKATITTFSFELILKNYLPQNCSLIQQSEIERQIDENTDFYGYKNKHASRNASHYLICVVGTSCGKIILINFNPILQLFSVEENHLVFSIKNCQRAEIQNLKGYLINQKNRMLLNGYTNEGKDLPVHHYCQFRHVQIDAIPTSKNGHKQTIKSLYISKQNAAVMMRGGDKKMRLFSMVRNDDLDKDQHYRYKCTGTINFSTFKKQYWLLPEINLYKKLQAIETTIYSIRLIQSKNFGIEEAERIKVCLLLNQIIPNGRQKQKYYNWIKQRRVKKEEETQFRQCDRKTKKPKEKDHKYESEAINEAQFNQIYQKIITSLTNSLGEEYMANFELEKAKNKKEILATNNTSINQIKSKKFVALPKNQLLLKKESISPSQSTQGKQKNIKNNENDSGLISRKGQLCKYSSRSYSHLKKSTFVKKMPNQKGLKEMFDCQFQSLKNRNQTAQRSDNDSKLKKKNFLFTPLKTAQKIISGRKVGSPRFL